MTTALRVHQNTAYRAVTDPALLVPGKWYCIGFENDEGDLDWGPIYLYEGDGCWTDDDGDIRHLFDPLLQMNVTTADAYAPQF